MSNNGVSKKIGGNHFVHVTVSEPRCKIEIDGESVYVDNEIVPKYNDNSNGVDSDLHLLLSRIANDAISQEKWIITNVSKIRVTTGFSNHNVLHPGESIDALLFAPREEINNSPCIQGAKKRGLITLEVVKKD